MKQSKLPQEQPKTIAITNFGGRLSRIINGDMNSGFAKFTTSFGYDPFTKPMNLTWFEAPVDITGPTGGGLMIAAKPRPATAMTVYAINSAGNLYTINSASVLTGSPNVDSVVGVASVTANSPTYLYGASMEFFGGTEKIYISNDGSIHSINFNGSGETDFGTTYVKQSAFHPLKDFGGKLLFGNGNTVGAIDSTGTITSSVIGTGQGPLYSELNPPLGVENQVRDIDASIDGNYALITASDLNSEQILTPGSDGLGASANNGYLYKWNGSDVTITAFTQIPSYSVTALQTYLTTNIFFADDSFGAGLNDGTTKLLTLPGNKSPLPNATLVNGNFISWINPEISPDGTTRNASLYYFGSLDRENPSGLYRIMRMSPDLANGFVYQTPLNILTGNYYRTVNSAKTAIGNLSFGKHYFSVMQIASGSTTYKLFRFLVASTGTGTPQLGVYETQTQLFSKRIGVSQIRVYTEPTATGNGFQLDMIDVDGSVVTNGTFNYTYGNPVDASSGSSNLERINFNPGTKTLFGLGIRLTNTGTTNMTIKKVEIDFTEEGK